MRDFIVYLLFTFGIGGGFFHVLSTTLTDMTQHDCRLGVLAACEQLQRGGVQK
jgi:hypothetical protein